jgi:hypothetical protein
MLPQIRWREAAYSRVSGHEQRFCRIHEELKVGIYVFARVCRLCHHSPHISHKQANEVDLSPLVNVGESTAKPSIV